MLLGSLLALTTAPLQGQETATLRGRVIDDETGEPIASANVRVGGAPALTTDSAGFFTAIVAAGEVEVSLQAIGYLPLRVKLYLQPGQRLEHRFGLEFSGEKLPDVTVTARAQRLVPRYADFERRRERGLGAFFRWDELKAKGYSTVGDALRTVRGVRIQCDQRNFECVAVMSRARNCPPSWWVDGVNVGSFHENTPIRDIYGIEIYRGAGEIPGEFAGSNAACGVIAIWTKSRPFR